jgi:hypothetical protein
MPHYLASYPRTAPTTGVTRIRPPAPIARRPRQQNRMARERPRDDAGLRSCRPRPSHTSDRPLGMACSQAIQPVINLT